MTARNAFAHGTTLTPEWRDDSGLSFVENYLRVDETPQQFGSVPDLPGYQLGDTKIQSMPLVVWTGGRLNNEETGVPIVVVIGNWDITQVMKFIRHLEGSCGGETRLQRLARYPEWIYHDLYSTFTDWNGIWDAARSHLGALDKEIQEQIGISNILERFRALSKAIAANIMLRESLNIEEHSLHTLLDVAIRKTGNREKVPDAAKVDFVVRCRVMSNALEHYSVRAKGTLEQLQNLFSMMVSLEQISQSQSVGRLNILAFIFLPLSFVTGVFGMTKFTISPRWYPVYALPMLVLTTLAAIVMPRIVSACDHRRMSRRSRQSEVEAPYDRSRATEKPGAESVYNHRRRSNSVPRVTAPTFEAPLMAENSLGWN
ncbi:hypothetical protein BKA64DRAFT_175457 [Cadophora sp. MPI-SDFR-AT-0126]|nr:hypothetical protein BKA64DRAFT_175457 [Leotiomycetes sp. MPI-SDFR-AT-0126]